jgi:RHS repeat-associated protein
MNQFPIHIGTVAAKLYRASCCSARGKSLRIFFNVIVCGLMSLTSSAMAQSFTWVDPPTTNNYMVGAKVNLELTGIYHPSTVQFVDGNTVIGTASVGICNNYPSNCNYGLSWTVPSAGSHTITANITNPFGTQFAPAITVTAESSTAPAVSMTSPSPSQVFLAGYPGYDITVSAVATSGNSTISKVEFFDGGSLALQGSGSNGTYTIPFRIYNAYDRSYTGYNELTFNVYAVATDGNGNKTVSATLPIRVGNTYRPSVSISGGGNRLVPLGAPLTVPISIGMLSQVGASAVQIDLYEDNVLKTTVTNPTPGSNSTYSINYTPPDGNSHNLFATLIDSQGALGASTTISVRVQYAPVPVVSWLMPDPSETWAIPTNGTLNKQLMVRVEVPYNSGGWINSVDFYDGTQLLGTGTFTFGSRGNAAQFAYDWNNIPAGVHSITAVATMSVGIDVTGTSPAVVMNVSGPQTTPGMYFVNADHLGTPRLIENQSQQAVWKWDNAEAFGDSLPNENPSGQGTFAYNQRYPGQYADRETGLNYNIARDYSPVDGRYIESDPIGLRAGPNTYAYVFDDPLRRSDPTGLCPCAGGTWDQDFGDINFTVSWGGFISLGNVNYTCRSNPALKCSGKQFCTGLGTPGATGVNWNIGGVVNNASTTGGLAGWSGSGIFDGDGWILGGTAGPVSGTINLSGNGGNIAVGPRGFGATLGRCLVYALKCNCSCD